MVTMDLAGSLGRAALFIGIPFLILIFIMQWRWAKVCAHNIRILVVQKSGGGRWELAPKEGGSISIRNPVDDSIRIWPINELSTIDVLYPGVGWMPEFLQKQIRLAIVNEGDWEPMLNRSPHRENILSPDVAIFLKRALKEGKITDPSIKMGLEKILSKASTGPSREMIADPAILGSLMQSSVMKALATVSNDFLDVMKALNAKMGKVIGPNPIVVYIGLGLLVILQVFTMFKVLPMADTTTHDLGLIKQSLGIVEVVPDQTPNKGFNIPGLGK